MTRMRGLYTGGAVLVAWAMLHGCGSGSGGSSQPGADDGGGDGSSVDASPAGDDGEAADATSGGDAAAGKDGGPSRDAAGDGALSGDDAGDDAGSCTSDSDCSPTGSICGLTTPGVCSPCATDADCKSDSYYQGMGWGLCDATTHLCEQGLCAVADGLACAQNPADVCCNGECSTGTCCSDTQCGGATPACHYHACVACDPVAGNVYYVDPNNGSDALDGSGTSGGHPVAGCAFRTLTHALSVIGSTPPSGTTILVLGPSQLDASTETFPITLPQNTRITNQGALVTVKVPATMPAADGGTQPGIGFVVRAPGVTIDSIAIDGQSNGAAHGVLVESGGALTVSMLDVHAVTGDAAMRVEGTGTASIGCGTFLTDGVRGLHVTDQAAVSVSCTLATILFSRNTADGIRVDGKGVLTLSGVPQSGGTGSVQASGDGVGLSMNPDATGGPPGASSIDGLVAWNDATGASLHGGAVVTVRRSQFLGGTIGVDVEPGTAGASWQYATGGIDLGAATGDAGAGVGGNVFQQPASADAGASAHNGGAGVCLGIPPTAGQTLNADGNTWVDAAGTASIDCALATGALSRNSAACTGGVDLGGAGLGTGTNTIHVAGCN